MSEEMNGKEGGTKKKKSGILGWILPIGAVKEAGGTLKNVKDNTTVVKGVLSEKFEEIKDALDKDSDREKLHLDHKLVMFRFWAFVVIGVLGVLDIIHGDMFAGVLIVIASATVMWSTMRNHRD